MGKKVKIVKIVLALSFVLLFVLPSFGSSTHPVSQNIELTINGGFSLRIGIINNGDTAVTGHYTFVDRTKTREGIIAASSHQISEQIHPTKRLGITTVTLTCNGQILTKPVLTLFIFVYVL